MHDRRGNEAAPRWRLIGLAAAATLAAAAVAACGTGNPSVAATPSPTAVTTVAPASAPAAATAAQPTPASPSTAPSSMPGLADACTAGDVKASHGLVEGAAGSVLTEVLLVADVRCSVDAAPVLGLRDGAGAAIVGGPASVAGRVELAGGRTYTSAVRVANWCIAEPSYPITLLLRLGVEELEVTGGPFPEEGNLPACNGEGPPILEGQAWAPTQP